MASLAQLTMRIRSLETIFKAFSGRLVSATILPSMVLEVILPSALTTPGSPYLIITMGRQPSGISRPQRKHRCKLLHGSTIFDFDPNIVFSQVILFSAGGISNTGY